jgi:hypothetical protein
MTRPNKFNTSFNPKKACTVCAKEVSMRRAVSLCYPDMTLCHPCYDIHVDNLYALSEKYDKSGITI